ncbi:MAG TPA: type VII secretion target [Micromonosporaceae bacterium]|nr:type VII secretion target [Micromonosporaceae bacterium]
MGYPDQFQADVARLGAIAREVRDAAGTVTSAVAGAQGRLAAPGGPEWTTVAASKAAHDTWVSYLTKLAASVSGLGSDLDTAAARYAQADQSAAATVGASGRARAI